MTRRCSHCSNNGHNSRTCPARGGGVRLFGVRLMEGTGTMKKSASMGCLSSSSASAALSSLAGASAGAASPSGGALGDHHYSTVAAPASGYASDDPARASCSSNCRSERKKDIGIDSLADRLATLNAQCTISESGPSLEIRSCQKVISSLVQGVPWTENEHRMFLMGLQKLGKGDWRGIARNFVVSRTPTQVASHAQKYFIRRSNASRRKRHSSLFDIVPEMPIDEAPNHEEQLLPHSPNELESTSRLPTLHLGLQGPEPAEPSTTMHAAQLIESIPRIHNNHPVPMLLPTFYRTFIPVPGPFWPSNQITTAKEEMMRETHKIVMPTPVVPKEPVNADEVVSMSKLSIGEGLPHHMDPSALSLRPSGTSSSSRQSAFHIDSSIAVPDLNQTNSSPIHAV
ncbi:unnamed protein product [Musa acuminata subsp. malaccensis]|uniref:(wild Malaysian banana) hypothetical protein n=1 Tax=Musa acuminata subsp. malaccensis TaxID=214687 RepID=A0A804K8Z3_MUSAM|nr:PREDICTED: transcription factor MYB1R1-like isoform X1 [Musa acuminata subsp. malaccensis]CAG1832246.1 unnamed protein product [Musa acuminata subsp. malaccensis]